MGNKRIQAVLPSDLVTRFEKQAQKQGRSESNLARLYIVRGLLEDEGKKSFSEIEMDAILNGVGVTQNLIGVGDVSGRPDTGLGANQIKGLP